MREVSHHAQKSVIIEADISALHEVSDESSERRSLTAAPDASQSPKEGTHSPHDQPGRKGNLAKTDGGSAETQGITPKILKAKRFAKAKRPEAFLGYGGTRGVLSPAC